MYLGNIEQKIWWNVAAHIISLTWVTLPELKKPEIWPGFGTAVFLSYYFNIKKITDFCLSLKQIFIFLSSLKAWVKFSKFKKTEMG